MLFHRKFHSRPETIFHAVLPAAEAPDPTVTTLRLSRAPASPTRYRRKYDASRPRFQEDGEKNIPRQARPETFLPRSFAPS